MSFFSSSVRNELVNEFWNLQPVRCPHDGAKLNLFFQPHIAGYLLVLACACCGRKAQITRFSDPQRVMFRAWTAMEKTSLATAQNTGAAPVCPVCQTAIQTRTDSRGPYQAVECLRCGNKTSGFNRPMASLQAAI